jgi:hypothetical protein
MLGQVEGILRLSDSSQLLTSPAGGATLPVCPVSYLHDGVSVGIEAGLHSKYATSDRRQAPSAELSNESVYGRPSTTA